MKTSRRSPCIILMQRSKWGDRKDGTMSRLRSIVLGMLGILMNDRVPTEQQDQSLTNDMYGMLAVLDKVGGGKPVHTPKPVTVSCKVRLNTLIYIYGEYIF